MAADRVVHEFPGDGFIRVRLLRMDVTDPTLHLRKPYHLVRGGHFRAQVELEELTLDELARLRDSLTVELLHMGRKV